MGDRLLAPAVALSQGQSRLVCMDAAVNLHVAQQCTYNEGSIFLIYSSLLFQSCNN